MAAIGVFTISWPDHRSRHNVSRRSYRSWLVLSRPDYQELYRAKVRSRTVQANLHIGRQDHTGRASTQTKICDLFRKHYRETMVFAQSELLEIAEAPVTNPVTGATIQLSQVPRDWLKGNASSLRAGTARRAKRLVRSFRFPRLTVKHSRHAAIEEKLSFVPGQSRKRNFRSTPMSRTAHMARAYRKFSAAAMPASGIRSSRSSNRLSLT